jgi:urease accessory protein
LASEVEAKTEKEILTAFFKTNNSHSQTMKHSSRNLLFLTAALSLLRSLAQAHPNHGTATGFASGLTHPLSGLDHLCAMIAIGLWAAHLGGRARWAVPLAFVSVMTLGSLAGNSGLQVPFAEQGIAASVLILGILIAAAVRLPLAASVAIVGLFALFHGYAHGAEMPAAVSGLTYAMGLIAATAALHLLGIGLGMTAQKFTAEKTLRYAGVVMAGCGLYLAFAV